MSSYNKFYEIWGLLTFRNHSIQIPIEATGNCHILAMLNKKSKNNHSIMMIRKRSKMGQPVKNGTPYKKYTLEALSFI